MRKKKRTTVKKRLAAWICGIFLLLSGCAAESGRYSRTARRETVTDAQAGVFENEVIRPCYALIAKEDYRASVPDFTPVTFID